MTEPVSPGSPRLRWWEGVASPGPGGYAVAVLVSLVVLGVLAAVVEGVGHGGDDPGGAFLGTVLFGSVFALFLAPPGVLMVHLLTLRVRPQWAHVLVTALVGGAAGLVVLQEWQPFVAMMALATAAGRAAVVPLVPGVQRRRRQREQRRSGLEQLARQGRVDGYGAPHRRPGAVPPGPPGPAGPARPADFGPTPPPG